MAALCGDFELWLADKLRALSIDPDVFGSYITGILEGTETEEEKSEALQGILSEVCEDGISEVKDEIFSKWSAYTQSPAEGDVRVDDEGKYNVEAKLVSLMEEQAKSVVPEKSVTVEEQKLRQAILAQYAEVSDGEEESSPVPKAAAVPEAVSAAASTGAPHKEHYAPKLLARNTNAETVAHAEKEKRELSKQEHERKKAQDKLNREKQKQQQQDRKDKERKRTQKGERRR
ncbi:coiled-coil domain-containing protein 43-like [Ixodes scapularis]|uniref:coiled-coil domain-containing protein 43-like n=1 Tax=Ixodes scapularis TaxID=6945 RepID=UPI00116184C3|nr:coiled-coil domain-containing protein 43-like [Ixodes scapularis]